jgi:organic hydroperoxide reductase OsmC/OhrA
VSEYRAAIRWAQSQGDFSRGRYSREHTWTFDGGLTVPASASPGVVPVPYSNPANVDPEEAFVASVASCHMLTFLDLARRDRLDVGSYEDDAVGTMTKNAEGKLWVSSVVLRPRIEYRGERPSREQETRLHHAAHRECFIANSVRTEITVEQEAR